MVFGKGGLAEAFGLRDGFSRVWFSRALFSRVYFKETGMLADVQVPSNATAAVVLADGQVFWGQGLGATTKKVGEICFNTSMTGYQESLTDPSYAGQIITFTFPHIGNVGVNDEDLESITPHLSGCIMRAEATDPANFRALYSLDSWLKAKNLPAVCGIDTRQLTHYIRMQGAPNGVIVNSPDGQFDIPALVQEAASWPGLKGMDLATKVGRADRAIWTETTWQLGHGHGQQTNPQFHVAVLDLGAKRATLRHLADLGCRLTVLPSETPAAEILSLNPDGIFLPNGPGDPQASAIRIAETLKILVESGRPIFGICLGHQLLALALGAKTYKMHLGHRGANHPIKNIHSGRVEITSQNHGFVVDKADLPAGVLATHLSLFDGSLAGIAVQDKPIFSVQYHPEGSPGPHDSLYLFQQFVDLMAAEKTVNKKTP